MDGVDNNIERLEEMLQSVETYYHKVEEENIKAKKQKTNIIEAEDNKIESTKLEKLTSEYLNGVITYDEVMEQYNKISEYMKNLKSTKEDVK